MSQCAWCGEVLRGKDWRRRKYCNRRCMSKGFTRKPTTAEAGRYQAQHFYAAHSCESCGVGGPRLHRHHANEDPTDNRPENIRILCAACHAALHTKPPPMSMCAACGRRFVAASHRNRNKICSAPCAAEWGRRCALKRWHGQDSCAPTETRSSLKSRRNSSPPTD